MLLLAKSHLPQLENVASSGVLYLLLLQIMENVASFLSFIS